MAKVQWQKTPLEKAIAELGQMADVNLVVDTGSVESIHGNSPLDVTLKIEDVTVQQVLDVVIDRLLPADLSERLSYAADGNIIRIGPRWQIESLHPILRVYDVRDLIIRGTRFRTALANMRGTSAPDEGCGAGGIGAAEHATG